MIFRNPIRECVRIQAVTTTVIVAQNAERYGE